MYNIPNKLSTCVRVFCRTFVLETKQVNCLLSVRWTTSFWYVFVFGLYLCLCLHWPNRYEVEFGESIFSGGETSGQFPSGFSSRLCSAHHFLIHSFSSLSLWVHILIISRRHNETLTLSGATGPAKRLPIFKLRVSICPLSPPYLHVFIYFVWDVNHKIFDSHIQYKANKSNVCQNDFEIKHRLPSKASRIKELDLVHNHCYPRKRVLRCCY